MRATPRPVSKSPAGRTPPAELRTTISIINRIAIDYAAPTGNFTDTITYTMTANYT
jgi:hypothetical protein